MRIKMRCDRICALDKQMSAWEGQAMSAEFYVIRRRSLPEALRRVADASELLATGEAATVAEAVRIAGISRSTFYKFRGEISELHEDMEGRTINLSLEVRDRKGVLSDILRVIAEGGGSILTIHQTVPVMNVALVSISLKFMEESKALGGLLEGLEAVDGVMKLRITGRQN